jgi:hypothetical protein
MFLWMGWADPVPTAKWHEPLAFQWNRARRGGAIRVVCGHQPAELRGTGTEARELKS